MEYQKIINLLDNTANQPTKFRTRTQVNTDSQIKFKTSMLRSSLCDYNDAYILVRRTVAVAKTAAQDQANNGTN